MMAQNWQRNMLSTSRKLQDDFFLCRAECMKSFFYKCTNGLRPVKVSIFESNECVTQCISIVCDDCYI